MAWADWNVRVLHKHLRKYTAGMGFRASLRQGGMSQGLILAVKAAHEAERRYTFDDAADQWQAILATYPQAPIAYAGSGGVLRQLNRIDEAEAILLAGMARFPDAPDIAIEHAWLAHHRKDHEGALHLCEGLIERFPSNARGYEGVGKAYRDLQRHAEAEAMFLQGRSLFPDEIAFFIEYAATADVQGNWAEGLARWSDLVARFPAAAIGYAGVGAALKRLKRYDEADAVLGPAMERFPTDLNLGVNHAWVADDRGDWAEALRRWTALLDRFGGHPRVRLGWVESQGRANLARIDSMAEQTGADTSPAQAPPPAAPAAGATAESMAFRDLFMGYESLGENCEFGFVQRHFGAEPLGLLRWAGVTLEKLMVGLDSGFEGVGSSETTEMHLNPSNLEYYTTDKFYGMSMHTFIMRDEGNEDRIYQKLCRRLQYLRNKLLADLAENDKLFVFQSSGEVSDAQLLALHAAMRRYGSPRLLCIRAQDEANKAGDVRLLGEGLMAGTIDRVGFDGRHWTISFDLWLQLCTTAQRMLAREPAH